MIVRRVGLGAICLALAADALMIPSTVSLPGLTAEALERHGDNKEPNNAEDAVFDIMPIDDEDWLNREEFLEKLKDLHLGVSKPFFFEHDGQDDENVPGHFDDEEDSDSDSDSDFGSDDGEDIQDKMAEFWDDFNVDDVSEYLKDGWTTVKLELKDGKFVPHAYGEDDEGVTFEELAATRIEEPKNECHGDHSIEAVSCQLRSMLKTKMEQVKSYFSHHRRPCPKKLAAMAKAKAEGLQRPKTSGGVPKFWSYVHDKDFVEPLRSSHYFSELHQHHQHHGSKFARVLHSICSGLRTFVTGFLIPVLIGVAAGMTASILGMCVGTFLAWLWIRFVRGGKRGNASIALPEETEVVKGEKEGLLESEIVAVEAPPVYVERV